MKTLVGFRDDEASRDALGVAAMIAGRDALAVCTVTPESWGYPSMARVDGEYAAFLHDLAQRTLAAAREHLGPVPAQVVHQAHPSVASGLLEAAQAFGAEAIVLGATREPALERLITGSATDALLHCSPLPVVIAPRQARGAAAVERLSVAYSGDPRAAGTVRRAAAMAQAQRVPLRIVTMVVRDHQMFPSTAGYDAERLVESQWRDQAGQAQRRIAATLPADLDVSLALGDGPSWAAALASLDWLDGEVLVLGSSTLSLVERVFLGSNARRIMQAASVPVMVVPRAQAESTETPT